MGRVNKKRANIANLEKLLDTFGKKISVRVGIIGQQAYQRHPGIDLTNAELGAVHEFGATINHPGGTPYLIKEDGTAQFVSKEKGENLPKTKPHQINIPARSFLREPILGTKGKKDIEKEVAASMKKLGWELSKDMELNKIAYQNDKNLNELLKTVADFVGMAAFDRVIKAFDDNLIEPPTLPASKRKRKYNPDAPTLMDTGQLRNSIAYEVKETK